MRCSPWGALFSSRKYAVGYEPSGSWMQPFGRPNVAGSLGGLRRFGGRLGYAIGGGLMGRLWPWLAAGIAGQVAGPIGNGPA